MKYYTYEEFSKLEVMSQGDCFDFLKEKKYEKKDVAFLFLFQLKQYTNIMPAEMLDALIEEFLISENGVVMFKYEWDLKYIRIPIPEDMLKFQYIGKFIGRMGPLPFYNYCINKIRSKFLTTTY